MRFFKRDKESESEKYSKKNGLKHCDSGGVISTETEMQIDSVREAYRGEDGRFRDLSEGIPFDYAKHVYVVILKELKGNRYLGVNIGGNLAGTISTELQAVISSFISSLGASVENVVISKLENDCLYAKIIFNVGGDQMGVDCRVFDAVGVAVSSGVRIYANEELLEKAGISLDPGTGKTVI